MTSPALRFCPECRQPWPVGAEHDLRSFRWLDGLPRSITPSNVDCAIHDGGSGRDRMLIFEAKGADELLPGGQERLLRSLAARAGWGVFILRGSLYGLDIARVVPTAVRPYASTTPQEVRAAVERFLNGELWRLDAPPPSQPVPSRSRAEDFDPDSPLWGRR